MPSAPQQPAARSPITRALLTCAGCAALLLGVIGVFVPGLPTTPFVLLAAALFAKGSPRLHSWLLNHRVLGPFVRDWEIHRALSWRIKCIALGSMAVMIGLSIWRYAEKPWIQITLLLMGAIGAWCVLRIPTRMHDDKP